MKFRLSIIAILSICISECFSQWVPLNSGLYSFEINSLIEYKGLLYIAARDSGIYVSSNNGNTWKGKNYGLANRNVRCIAAKDDRIFVGTDIGVFLSTDNGDSWTLKSNGLPPGHIFCIIITSKNVIVGKPNGIYISSDWGETWVEKKKGMQLTTFVENKYAIFGGTLGYGIIKSTDNGDTWNETSSGLFGKNISLLYELDDNIYAGNDRGELFLSSNNGSDWIKKSTVAENSKIISMYFYNGCFYVGANGRGIFTSYDSCKTWKHIDVSSFDNNSIVIKDSVLFIGSNKGVLSSGDLGKNWVYRNIGFTSISYPGCKFALKDSVFYFGYSSLLVSKDYGNTWYDKNNGMQNWPMVSILFKDSLIIIGTDGGGIFVSADKGENWIEKNEGLDYLDIKSVILHGDIIVAGSKDGGIYISHDNCNTWTNIDTGLDNIHVLTLFSNNNNIYAGTANCVLLSGDNGITWEVFGSNSSMAPVSALEECGGVFFAGITSTGIYDKQVNDEYWDSFEVELDSVKISCLLTYNNNLFAASCNNKGIYISTDTGKTFRNVGNELSNSDVFGLTRDGNYLFAATSKGIYWANISDLLNTLEYHEDDELIQGLTILPNPANIETALRLPLGLECRSITIYNFLGVAMSTATVESDTENPMIISLEGLPSGIYLCSVATSKGIITEKLIISK